LPELDSVHSWVKKTIHPWRSDSSIRKTGLGRSEVIGLRFIVSRCLGNRSLDPFLRNVTQRNPLRSSLYPVEIKEFCPLRIRAVDSHAQIDVIPRSYPMRHFPSLSFDQLVIIRIDILPAPFSGVGHIFAHRRPRVSLAQQPAFLTSGASYLRAF